MTLDYLEEVAQEKNLRGDAHQEYERMLDVVLDKEKEFRMWNILYIASTALFFWGLLFGCVLYLLSLDYEFQLWPNMGLGLSLIIVVFFPMFLISMFLRDKHSRELAAMESRVLAFLESR